MSLSPSTCTKAAVSAEEATNEPDPALEPSPNQGAGSQTATAVFVVTLESVDNCSFGSVLELEHGRN